MSELHRRQWRGKVWELLTHGAFSAASLPTVRAERDPQYSWSAYLPAGGDILHPWWNHPGAKYIGRHRGDFEWWSVFLAVSWGKHAKTRCQRRRSPYGLIPYGVRNIVISAYTDAWGTALGRQPVFELPSSIAFSFSEEPTATRLVNDEGLVV